MDFTGTLLGVLTIPMALLTAGSGVAGLWLILRGDWWAVLLGVVLFLGGTIIARLSWISSTGLAAIAGTAIDAGQRPLGRLMALLSAAWPVLVILLWEIAVFHLLELGQPDRAAGGGIASWLWSYGVATGIWSWQAHRASSESRTLKSIQAYSAQIAYALLSAPILLLGWPVGAAILLMLVPMMLPLTVGTLIALADRNALRDVRI